MADDQTQSQDPAAKAQDVTTEGADAKAPPQQKIEKGIKEIDRAYKERAALDKAKKFGISYVNIAKTPINPDLLQILTPEVAKKAMIMPFFRIGRRLRIAVADPDKPEACMGENITKRIISKRVKQ